MANKLPKKYKLKLNSVEKIEELLQELYEEADKNMHVYQDEPVEAEIDGVKMTELSCCYITETSFKMTVEESFLTQIYERKELKK